MSEKLPQEVIDHIHLYQVGEQVRYSIRDTTSGKSTGNSISYLVTTIDLRHGFEYPSSISEEDFKALVEEKTAKFIVDLKRGFADLIYDPDGGNLGRERK